ncbi:hypothetical protein PTKIN_Ptkin08bG0054800 [Pterospermum kingtungense]
MTEILLGLPVRSLLRFKCVLKSWYDLINHPKFVAEYTARNRTNKHRILIKRQFDETYFDVNEFSLSPLSWNDMFCEDLIVFPFKREPEEASSFMLL